LRPAPQDRVRVSGGAYGGFCDFDSHSGMFTYLSYRDPNLLGTLDNYDGTGGRPPPPPPLP
jgi:Zn-dependent M16 (insulinase) family peptidase